jgi:ACS family hexuronate transporter-like MFS transporter
MQAIGKYRWVVVILLFFATTINYLDRQVIGLLKDDLSKQFDWSEKDYGRLIDRIGTKAGYTISVIVWSLAAMAHGLVKSTFGFGMARSALGLGEAGNFPAAIKTVAEWFPKKERALATGLFNSGCNVAAIAGPPLIAWIFTSYGWQEAFVWTGVLGFVWLIFWRLFYEVPARQKKLSKQEFDYIHSDTPEEESTEKISWLTLLRKRQTWTFVSGKFLSDPIWWFYLFWVPTYFNTTFHLDLKKSALHVSTVYLAASVGSIFGGYLSGLLIKKGFPIYKARKVSMFIFAMLVVPVVFIQFTTDVWVAVALISLAAAAHQAWSANIYTTASDMFPKKAVSSVVGIGSMAGAAGGILFPLLIGILLEHFKLAGQLNTGYNIIFVICGSAYLLAWLIMHFLSPSMKQVVL